MNQYDCPLGKEYTYGVVTNYWEVGGGYKTGGGVGKVLPLQKGGGAEKVLAML